MEKSLAVSPSVFVLELVSTGYFGDDIGTSFRAEGRAMLDAALADLRRLPGVTAQTIDDATGPKTADAILQMAADHTANATLIIAPEFDGLLERFCAAAAKPDARSLNCGPDAIGLCADKWRFFQHLQMHGIPTISTELVNLRDEPPELPCVLKPRDGAGSWLVRHVRSTAEWNRTAEEYRGANRFEILRQPYVAGLPCSIAAIVRPHSAPDILPIALQRLSADGEFRYLGGEIPASLPDSVQEMIRRYFRRLIESIPGLNGYIGCDLIVPDDDPQTPLIVELNPRLTTSYIGYRAQCRDNLFESLLFSNQIQHPLRWNPQIVSFSMTNDQPE